MKTGTCEKCGIEYYIDHHHVFPRQFFKDKTVIPLCPNCHRDIHVKLPKGKQKKSFYQEFTKKWLAGLLFFLLFLWLIF